MNIEKKHNNISYDNIHKIHDPNINEYLIKRQALTNSLLSEISYIKKGIHKLLSKKDLILNSICDEDKKYLMDTVSQISSSFSDLDTLMDNLKNATDDYDKEISKYLSFINDTSGSLSKEEIHMAIGTPDETIFCPKCLSSFKSCDEGKICPSCGYELT